MRNANRRAPTQRQGAISAKNTRVMSFQNNLELCNHCYSTHFRTCFPNVFFNTSETVQIYWILSHRRIDFDQKRRCPHARSNSRLALRNSEICELGQRRAPCSISSSNIHLVLEIWIWHGWSFLAGTKVFLSSDLVLAKRHVHITQEQGFKVA